MEIYFFDTPSLTLLKDQHLILRLRKKGETWTFTVKERPTTQTHESDGYPGTLETDVAIGSKEKVPTYSIECNPSMASVRAAIDQHSIRGMFSLPQRDFLKERLDQIPWEAVRSFPKIEARRWKLPESANLTAEEWTYPTGEVLELSCKAKTTDTAAAEKKFTTYLTDLKIDPKTGSGLKTTIVLETLARRLPPK